MSLNLLDKSQFVGYFTIDFSDIADDFTPYADQTEKKIMIDLFGKAMYDDMLTNPTEQKYVDLINNYNLSDMMRDFFYYYYLRDRQSYSSTLGEFQSQAQNATRSLLSRNRKIADKYNLGVELYWNAANFVNDNKDTYDLYTSTVRIYQTNAFGIEHYENLNSTIPCTHYDWFIRGCR